MVDREEAPLIVGQHSWKGSTAEVDFEEKPPTRAERVYFRTERQILVSSAEGGTVDQKRVRFAYVIDNGTSMPCRVALRWGLRRRRPGKFDSFYRDLQVVAWVYEWAARGRLGVGDLDAHFLTGQVLDSKQLAALFGFLDSLGRPYVRGAMSDGSRCSLSEPNTLNHRLRVAASFLRFAYDPDSRMGAAVIGGAAARDSALKLLASEITKAMAPNAPPVRKTEGGALTFEQLARLRALLSCQDGKLSRAFSIEVGYRNWLMFEVGWQCGFRISEILALQVSGLPKRGLTIRLDKPQDDSRDKRIEEPTSKTVDRDIGASPSLITHLHHYVDSEAAWGRKNAAGSNKLMPFLFTSRHGRALSRREATKIMASISEMVGFRVTWHRLRHTFARIRIDDGMTKDEVAELMGNTLEGVAPYVKESLHRRVNEKNQEVHAAVDARLNALISSPEFSPSFGITR